MTGIQLIAILCAALMMFQVYINFKKKDLSPMELLVWEVLWGGLLLVSLLPDVFRHVISIIHVARLLDLVTIAGLLLLGVLAYQLYVDVHRMRRKIDNLVRQLALQELDPPPTSPVDEKS